MNTAIVESGDLTALTNMFNEVGEAQSNQFVKALDGINWASVSVEDLQKRFKDFGIATNFTDT
jgi:hypothetical protein